ncbi:MAG: GIY-YIG nuclease family protein [Patescibacteria group bacterium]
MFFVYILKSSKDENLYVGSTSNLKKRFQEHNSGQVQSTKPRRPFKMVYIEGYAEESEARHREHNLKLKSQAFAQLMIRIKKSVDRA